MINLLTLDRYFGRRLGSSQDLTTASFLFNYDSEKCIASLETPSDNASSYANYHSISRDRNYLKYFKELILKVANKGQVLEIGCNNGELLEELYGNGFDLIGVDPTLHSESLSSIRYFKDYWSEEFISRNRDLFSPNVIVARHVLEHVPDYDHFIKCLDSVASKETVLFLEVPDLFANLMYSDITPVFTEHLHYFSIPGIQKAFNKHNWYIKDYKKISYWGGSVIVTLTREPKVFDFEDLEIELRILAQGFQSALDRKNSLLFAELNSRTKLHGSGVLFFGVGNRALNLFSTFKNRPPVDYFVDNSVAKEGLSIPYFNDAQIVMPNSLDFRKIHTIFITGFGYEREILKQLQAIDKLHAELEIITFSPEFKISFFKDLESSI